MATPSDTSGDSFEDDYEEYTEFQCPICKEPVADTDETCPGCGAIFVDSGDEEGLSLDEVELEMDYQLDDQADYGDVDEEALEAEIAALEDTRYAGVMMDDSDADLFDLDLAYEDELADEDEEEEIFGGAVKVTADDHAALEELSRPNILERTFTRMGLGMFIAGGAATVLIVLWDPINGNPISLGMTQWRFLVLAMSMFIVGFAIEMIQAFSLSKDDEKIIQELLDA
ncbi:MAG: hypothetical protein GWN18_04700 [Thermoplasmata archaeon]|nr:zinc ribbon domain-containing protein [Thermoplasmata archaeon]NIS11325.1 zinc ribbon domain-containing protein [Thermoplasmata archaeon]NIS19263.1 zinc ribbon domain-containing protein [Thermoplasmata archaeon]NIT76338.1 zinc ribbon domain-containing protein [Thermoplasmata archaeon]NIU48398.1 zinc ribbon domain-containing protein [Thermoplasmata archaeon]